MSGRRALGRNVFIWHLNGDNEDRIPLGGLVLTAGVTNTGFRQMLDILLITSGDCVVQNEHGDETLRDDQPLLPGDYTVSADSVEVTKVNNEVVYTRSHSIATGTRVESFKEEVQARDAYERQWDDNNYGRWITIDPPQGVGKINSVQNGIILRADLHILFDCFAFSINPDDFPPGSDIMGEIMAGPKAAERMEFELFDRLAHHMEIL
ncbi:uncharacterized protein B0T15DRAFT_509390 [Chaetomium strumarium]|uniref:HNH nuclease domain-containing protein n=1 Tax=Chaetomium strumarium TaxID=1170767 RepID=A0AAJ0M4X6_9PEZI|nr:hypothetical protein B0T15DRAFT_509390 [Chaetomium strumarium]